MNASWFKVVYGERPPQVVEAAVGAGLTPHGRFVAVFIDHAGRVLNLVIPQPAGLLPKIGHHRHATDRRDAFDLAESVAAQSRSAGRRTKAQKHPPGDAGRWTATGGSATHDAASAAHKQTHASDHPRQGHFSAPQLDVGMPDQDVSNQGGAALAETARTAFDRPPGSGPTARRVRDVRPAVEAGRRSN